MKCSNCGFDFDYDRFPVCPYCLTSPGSLALEGDTSSGEDNVHRAETDTDCAQISADSNATSNEYQLNKTSDSGVSQKVIEDSNKNYQYTDVFLVDIPGMSNRCKYALLRNGIKTLRDLNECITSNEIYTFRSVGPGIISEAKSFVNYAPTAKPTVRIPISRYFNNRYSLFTSYCEENGIQYIDELASIDLEELMYIKGLGVKKINEISSMIKTIENNRLLINEGSPKSSHMDTSPALFTNIDMQVQSISISIIESLGVSKECIKRLRTRGVLKVGDLCNFTERKLTYTVGAEDFETVKRLEEIFSLSLKSVIEKILDEQSSSMDFSIILKRAEGYTLQEVADCHTVTRERIRQRESKYLKFLDDYIKPLVDSIIIDKGYATVQDVLDIYDNDNYDKVLIYWCNKSGYLSYLSFADLYLPKSIDEKAIYSNLNNLIEDFVGEGARIRDFRNDIEEKLDEFGYFFLNIDLFIDYLLTVGYKRHDDYIVLRNTTYGYLCARLIEKYYPNGFKLYDSFELDQLRQYANAEYGPIGIPDSNRAMSSRIADYTVLSGRGMVTAPENIQIDLDMLEEIKEYIDAQPSSEIYYSDLYRLFEGLITMRSNIDNYNFLHGVLRYYYNDEYVFSRDYLIKQGNNLLSGKTTDRLKSLIAEMGRPVSKKEILARWPGITPIVLFNALSDKSLFLWEAQQYYSIEMLVMDDNTKEKIQSVIDKTLEEHNGYCSEGLLYSVITDACPNFIIENNMMNASNLFYACAKLFNDFYDFRHPHMCSKALISDISLINVIKHLLNDPKEIDYSVVKKLGTEFRWSDVTISAMFYDLAPDYVRVTDSVFVKKTDFHINNSVVEFVRDYILKHMRYDCFSLLNYDSFDEFPDVGYTWNVFLLRSIIERSINIFRIVDTKARDRRYERGIVVSSEGTLNDYIDVVVHLIKCNGNTEISESNLLSLLVLNDLSYKIIPQELYGDQERLHYKDGLFTIDV